MAPFKKHNPRTGLRSGYRPPHGSLGYPQDGSSLVKTALAGDFKKNIPVFQLRLPFHLHFHRFSMYDFFPEHGM